MGFFDLIGEVVDSAIDLAVNAPGKIVEASCEAVTRIPEAGIKIVQGAVNGVEKGIDKIGDAID